VGITGRTVSLSVLFGIDHTWIIDDKFAAERARIPKICVRKEVTWPIAIVSSTFQPIPPGFAMRGSSFSQNALPVIDPRDPQNEYVRKKLPLLTRNDQKFPEIPGTPKQK